MKEIATLLSVEGKAIIKAFCSVLYTALHCPILMQHCTFNNAFLQRGMDMVIYFRNRQACG
jgi:hypothetical protein